MSLAKYLKGVPPQAQRYALEAAARSIYSQHLNLLEDLHKVQGNFKDQILDELADLKADASEILALNIVQGHNAHKLEIVDRLNVAREITLLKLAEREKAKLKALNITPPTN